MYFQVPICNGFVLKACFYKNEKINRKKQNNNNRVKIFAEVISTTQLFAAILQSFLLQKKKYLQYIHRFTKKCIRSDKKNQRQTCPSKR